MVTVDFSLGIALFFVIFIGSALIIWFLSKKEKDKDLSLDPKFIWFCSVCTYTYINTKEDVISVCPRCNSYNKK